MAYVTRYQKTVSVTASGGVSHSIDVMPDNGGWLESVVVRNATAQAISTAARLLITQGGRSLWDATSTGASNTTVTWYPRTQVSIGTTLLAYTSAATPPPIAERMAIAGLVPINIQVTSGGLTSGSGARTVQVDLYIGG